MSLESMLQGLEQEALLEKNKIKEQADQQIQTLLNEAGAEVKKLRDEILAQAKEEMDTEEAKTLGSAKSQRNQLLLEARRQAFDQVFARAQEEIHQTTKSPDYPELLQNLIQESLSHLTGKITVEVSPRDVSLAQKIFKELHREAEVRMNQKVASGIIVRASEQKLIIENTLENRLAKAMNGLTTEVVSKLWPQ